MKNVIILFLFAGLLWACTQEQKTADVSEEKAPGNPAAEGFNLEGSDSQAIEIADEVMSAMGGRATWDSTRYMAWNFFGVRDLLWDKLEGKVRIESPRDSSIYLVNVFDNTGQVMRRGQILENPDSVSKYVNIGKSIWINDSYWLVMPFKLKDSGVTLKYNGEGNTLEGKPSHILELTFNAVGDTPDNKYEVFVDKEDNLVKQWSFYRSAEQDSASAIWPWDNYQDFKGIKLSGDRSDGKGPKNVKVLADVPEEAFTSFDPISLGN
ncbi:MAG: hypothetical protein AAFX87_15450 [Bacteroidota bacterium]